MKKLFLILVVLLPVLVACKDQGPQKPKPPLNGDYYEGDTINFTKYVYKNGVVVSQATFVNNRIDGTATEFFNDGKPRLSIEYVDGRRNGLTTTYYDTGEKHGETTYVDGKKEGVAFTYMKNGNITSEVPYHNNKPIPGIKEFDAKGEPVEQPKGKITNKGGKVEIRLTNPKFPLSEVFTEINGKQYQVNVEKGVAVYGSTVPKGTIFRIIYKTPQGQEGAVDVKY